MSRSKKSVTQHQIAEVAGVSQTAVSAILANSGASRVSETTRKQVLKIAARMGYVIPRPAPAKKSAARGHVLLVENAGVSLESREHWVSMAYDALRGKIISEAGTRLHHHDLGISVYHLQDDGLHLMEWLAGSGVIGVIWHASDPGPSLLHWIASRYPTVLLNHGGRAHAFCDTVGVSQELNISLPAEYLWSRGHRKIALFGSCPTNPIFARRIGEYRRFIREKGLREYREFLDLPDEQERPADEKVRAILDLWQGLAGDAPTAIILSDVFALRLVGSAAGRGISVPGDLSVIGIDNTAPCEWVTPPLTSMRGPYERICHLAVDLLARRLDHPREPAQTIAISPELVERDSVRTLPVSTPGTKSATARKPGRHSAPRPKEQALAIP